MVQKGIKGGNVYGRLENAKEQNDVRHKGPNRPKGSQERKGWDYQDIIRISKDEFFYQHNNEVKEQFYEELNVVLIPPLLISFEIQAFL